MAVIVEVAVCPAGTFALVGLAFIAKSVTVRVTSTERMTQQCVTSLAVTVMVQVVNSVVLVAVAVKVPLPEPIV